MKRYGTLILAGGLGVLAMACWLGDTACFSWLNGANPLADWSTAGTAYAAPPRRGSVVRTAPVSSYDYDEEPSEPGLIVSDRASAPTATAPSRPAPRYATPLPRTVKFDDEDAALLDDEPAELVAGRPLPARRAPASNEPFVSRRRASSPTTAAADPQLPTIAPASSPLESSLVEPDSARQRAPTLVDPEENSLAPVALPGDDELPGMVDSADAAADTSSDNTPSSTTARRTPAADRYPGSAPTARPAASASSTMEPEVERQPRSFEQSPSRSAAPDDAQALFPIDSDNSEERLEAPQSAKPAASRPSWDEPASAPNKPQEPEAETDSIFERHAAETAGAARGVLLRWETPAEIQVDTETECRLLVENTTDEVLSQVTVEAQLPVGLSLARTEPATAASAAKLAWSFPTLEAREQQTIRLWVTPTGQGEVEPTATVTFTHATAARLQVIDPQLQLEAIGPASVLSGQPVGMKLLVSNPGTGRARSVVVEVQLDPNLQHAAGDRLRYAIGTLGAGESREVQVTLNPTQAGQFEIRATANAEPGLSQQTRYELEVLKPTLQVAVEGPRLRYVDRQATYLIKVHNPGPSPADNVQVFDEVPSGFRFVEASAGGTFDEQARQVAWFVGRLEPHQSTEVNVQLVAIEPGEQRIAAAVKADAGVSEVAEAVTRVEGVASIALDVIDADDPVEVAGETTYEIRLTNRGTQPARQVQAAAKLPLELQALEATGPTAGKIQGSQVIFEPLDSLAPGQTEVFHIRVHCRRAGQVTFKAFYRDADHPNPVAEEEVTRVYQD